MTEYVRAIVHFAELHAGLVYVLAFAASWLEALAVVGLVIPGSGVIVALGALVPSGAVSFWWLCLWSVLGALAGDGLSYWFGHHYRDRMAHLWPFSRHPGLLEHGQRFFAAHGGKSVFLARFLAPVRGSVPLVAGTAGMAPGRFFAVSVLSALGWAPAHILPGALIGAGLTLTGGVASRLLILVIVLAALLWLSARITVFTLRHSRRLLVWTLARIDDWAHQRNTWLAREALAMLDPSRGEAGVLVLLWLVLLAAAWVFFGVLEDVVSGDPLVRADMAIYNALQGLRSAIADRVMIAVTELGSATVAGAVTLAVLLWLCWRRAWHTTAYWLAAVGGASLIGMVIKLALHRPRPIPVSTGWDAFSFPSGHATTNAAIYGFLAVLLARDVRPAWQALIAGSTALGVAMVGFSRLYLGAHWFSDVVGGIAFGTAWIALLALVYMRHDPSRLRAVPLAAVAIATLTAVGSVQVAHKMPGDRVKYAVRHAERTVTEAVWWREGWRGVPARRIDLIGGREEPLVLQWAGNLGALQSGLVSAGWREPPPWSAESALGWLGPIEDPMTLPVLPRLHDGRAAGLTLIHDDPGAHPSARWVLRVWKAGIRLVGPQGGGRPLWVGAITRQRFDGALAPFGLRFERSRIAVPWPLLQGALPDARLAERRDGAAGIRVLLAREPAVPGWGSAGRRRR